MEKDDAVNEDVLEMDEFRELRVRLYHSWYRKLLRDMEVRGAVKAWEVEEGG